MSELSRLLDTGVLEEELQPSEWDTLEAAFKPEVAREPLDPRDNAAINWLGCPGLSAAGYADAATILTNWTLQTGRHQDLLVYPILFLFRHHIELRLKEIMSLAQSLRGREGSPPLGHDLMKLWCDVREVGARLRLRMGESWNYMERCIRELSEVDPTSEAFRYRTDRKGEDMVLAEPGSRGERRVKHVNLRALGRTMARVVMWLDGVKTALEAMQDYIGETWGAC